MTQDLDFIHEFIPGKTARTLLLLHGTGGNERDLISIGRKLDPEAALLSPRGKVLENGMPRFFRRLAEGIFDLEDLTRRTKELGDFILAASQHYELAADKIIAVGYSNGANIAASVLLLRPEILQRAILFRALIPILPEPLPNLAAVSVFISAGNQDSIIEPSETERLANLLRKCGASVEFQFVNGGHRLTSADLTAAKLWLEKQSNEPVRQA